MKPNIMFVDDSISVLESLRWIFMDEPYHVFAFDNPLEALNAIRAKDFAVVVNRFGIGNDDVLDYCEKENIPILAKIPNDRNVAELYSRGELVYQKIPEVKQQLENVKDYILKLEEGGRK